MSSYSSTYPSVSPTWQCNFAANGGRIDPRATFSRPDSPINPSNAGASSLHYWSNEKHLSSENLIPYSNNIGVSAWSKVRLTVDSTNNAAPDGGADASLLLETADTGTHTYYESFNSVSGQNYSFTFFAKPNGRTKVQMRPQATGSGGVANLTFDLTSTGTVTLDSGSTVAHSITQIGDYYKCSATITATGTGTGYMQIYLDDGTGYSYAGDATKGLIVWGHQISSTSETVVNETSGQIHRSYAPTLKSPATAGAARFEYDPETNASQGILIEGQSTNLLLASESFNDSYWTKQNATVEFNSAVAPDGSLSGDLLIEAAETSPTTNSHYVYSGSITPAASTTYTFSVYLKAAGRSNALLYTNIGGVNVNTIFNLTNGTVTSTQGSVTSLCSSVGNGWFRCSMTFTTTSAAASDVRIYTVDGSGSFGYTGNGYGSVLLWGAQLEQASHASSYITTLLSTRTRAADSLSVTDASLFGTGSGAVVVEAGPVNGTFYPTLFDLTDTTTSNRVLLQSGATGTPTSLTVAADGNASVGVVSEAVTMSDRKFAVSYDTNSFKLANNGGAVSEDTSGQLPQQLSKLSIGTDNGGGGALNGNIKRIAVYGEALSDTNLQAITS